MTEVLRVVGTVAGIGGLSLGVVLLVYRDFLREFLKKRAFRTLSAAQATLLIAATITFTFAVAVLGIFAGLVPGSGAVLFIALVGMLLLFILGALVVASRLELLSRSPAPAVPDPAGGLTAVQGLVERNQLDEADRELARVAGGSGQGAEFWYWKARVALARDNVDVATAYVDQALRRDGRNTGSVALKIRLLLLSGKRGDSTRARELAEHSRGIDSALDAWLTCLTAEDMFAPGVRTNTQLDTRCPYPWGA